MGNSQAMTKEFIVDEERHRRLFFLLPHVFYETNPPIPLRSYIHLWSGPDLRRYLRTKRDWQNFRDACPTGV